MKKKNQYSIVVLTLIFAFVILPLILYWAKFGSFQLAKDFEIWVSFANYWSPFLTLATAIFTGIIAYHALTHNEKVESPLITFEMVKVSGKQYYIIKNAGRVPAVNCFLQIQENGSQIEWDQTVNCYVIKPEEVKVISWNPDVQKARMFYENFAGKKFTTTMLFHQNYFDLKAPPTFREVLNYSNVSAQSLEDEILKSLSGSSENKDDLKMVTELLLEKARDCNQLYVTDFRDHGYGDNAYSRCLEEVVISLQLLTTMIDAMGSQFIVEKNGYFKKMFWIQLNTRIRIYIKKSNINHNYNELNNGNRGYLDTLHNHFQGFYEEY